MPSRRKSHRLFLTLVLTTIAFATLATPVFAENIFSLYTGSSFSRDTDLQINQRGGTGLTLHNVRWDANPFKAAPYYGLRYTHFLDRYPNWGIAVDYTHYKMYAQTGRVVAVDGTWRGAPVNSPARMDQYVQHFEMSHGVNLLSVNGVYRWQGLSFLNGRLEPYIGAGLVHYRPHSENTVDNQVRETGYEPSGLGYQLLGGAQYRLGRRWGAFAELKFNSGTANVGIADGTAETELRTFHALGGLQYSF